MTKRGSKHGAFWAALRRDFMVVAVHNRMGEGASVQAWYSACSDPTQAARCYRAIAKSLKDSK